MSGKRKNKRRRGRLPGLVALVCVLAVLVSPKPADAANSPVEGAAPAVRTAEHAVPAPVTRAAPAAASAAAAAETKKMPELPAAEPEPEWAPVPEGAAQEDTYFADAVFLGDSRTEGFHLYSGLKEGTYFYAVGATVESVFTKAVWEQEGDKVPLLDAVAGASCGKIYVMLGVNELGWNKVETFTNQYAKVIDRLREDHPDAEVVIQSILPVSAHQDAKGTYVNNQRIRTFNEAIVALAEEKDCAYVNVAEAVTGEDGCLRPELTSDGVHLNTAGCKIWLDYLRNHPV